MLGIRSGLTRYSTYAAAAGVVVAAFACAASAAWGFAPLSMGIQEPSALGAPLDSPLWQRMADAGAASTRVSVYWNEIAPNGTTAPANFDARSPTDPHYDWAALDAFVRGAAAHNLEPLIAVLAAPRWAEGPSRAKTRAGTFEPNAAALGDFATALARRYDGRTPDPLDPSRPLPRVRDFQAWNEPNYREYLVVRDGRSPAAYYVRMLNAFYAGVKAVDSSNVVIAGGLAPFGKNRRGATDVDPQAFMRGVLCLQKRRGTLRRGRCGALPHFDVWAHHPYTFTGGPTTSGSSPDAGALGNMPAISRTLRHAVALRLVRPLGSKPLWVTEFDWLTKPPGVLLGGRLQLGKPPAVQARYLSETAYRLWSAGVSRFIWYELRDQRDWPGGLYFAGQTPATDRPKPALAAFRLPFYAGRSGRGVRVWALAARSPSASVAVERATAGTWRVVAMFHADANGIVYGELRGGRGRYRIRILSGPRTGETSPAFSVR